MDRPRRTFSGLLWSARISGRGIDSAGLNFAAVFAFNVGLVLLCDILLGRGRGDIDLTSTAFFVLLFSVLVTLYDRYYPVYETGFTHRNVD